jgi:signal transduction histidine kinase
VTDHTLTFSVHDEGPGFDIEVTPEGMGIQIVRDRIAALDGALTLESSAGGGTTVTGRLPVDVEAPSGASA